MLHVIFVLWSVMPKIHLGTSHVIIWKITWGDMSEEDLKVRPGCVVIANNLENYLLNLAERSNQNLFY